MKYLKLLQLDPIIRDVKKSQKYIGFKNAWYVRLCSAFHKLCSAFHMNSANLSMDRKPQAPLRCPSSCIFDCGIRLQFFTVL